MSDLQKENDLLRGVLREVLELATWDEEEHDDFEPTEDDMSEALTEIHRLAAMVLRPSPSNGTETKEK